VFLGDSLTEGVGFARMGYVSALARLIAQDARFRYIHEMRARNVDPLHFNRFLKCNVAGFWQTFEALGHQNDLWIWNLASEGTTIDSDALLLPLIRNINPELVIIFRGSLETILRPPQVKHNCWPQWIPRAWRGYASMDPRCYFSASRARAAKQRTIDYLKQKARLRMLRLYGGQPLVAADRLIDVYSALLSELHVVSRRVLMLGLLPVSETTFPGSRAQFLELNSKLHELAMNADVEFLDWGQEFYDGNLIFRDGFHPNEAGAQRLASLLCNFLVSHGLLQT
jgi:hypothetical protein